MLRERAGADSVELELDDGATVADAVAALAPVAGEMPFRVAVNREYADADDRLEPGDELAAIPPVSGGSPEAKARVVRVAVSAEPLDLAALVAAVSDAGAGAIVTFQGVTREVDLLEYEAYEEMAAPRIEAIMRDCGERHGLRAVAAEHRVGEVPLGEPQRDRRGLGRAPRRGFRRRPRGDRPDQGGGADLEEGGRRRRRELGGGCVAVSPEDRLTHLDEDGAARMVDVGAKAVSERIAVAEARVRMSPEAAAAVERGDAPKGDVIGTARIAGIQAAKRTAELIPLAHPLPLTFVDVRAEIDGRRGTGRSHRRGPDRRPHRRRARGDDRVLGRSAYRLRHGQGDRARRRDRARRPALEERRPQRGLAEG